jgi:hypothetical protein
LLAAKAEQATTPNRITKITAEQREDSRVIFHTVLSLVSTD